MSATGTQRSPVRLFGTDLSALWADLLTAWRGMAAWPIFAWLWPEPAVKLWLPTGERLLCRDMKSAPVKDDAGMRKARFDAVLAPDHLLLHRELDLPALQSAEMSAAIELEVQTLNPFAGENPLWVSDSSVRESGALVHISLTSRRLIDQHIREHHPQFATQSPEVWVPCVAGPGYHVLPGFGEARRQQRRTAWRWTSVALIFLALCAAGAVAITPSLRLFVYLLQANQSMSDLQSRARSVLAQREVLVRATDQLTRLGQMVSQQVVPLEVIKLVTDALPDDTSLLSLQIQGLKVTMNGQTANAAALMKQLGATAGMKDVRAPSAATKPLGAPRESFVIEFSLDPSQVGARP